MPLIGMHTTGWLLWLFSPKRSAVFVILTVVHAIALSSTIYRFRHRFKHDIQLWLDDVFAFVTTVGELFALGVLASTGESGHHLTLTCLNRKQSKKDICPAVPSYLDGILLHCMVRRYVFISQASSLELTNLPQVGASDTSHDACSDMRAFRSFETASCLFHIFHSWSRYRCYRLHHCFHSILQVYRNKLHQLQALFLSLTTWNCSVCGDW